MEVWSVPFYKGCWSPVLHLSLSSCVESLNMIWLKIKKNLNNSPGTTESLPKYIWVAKHWLWSLSEEGGNRSRLNCWIFHPLQILKTLLINLRYFRQTTTNVLNTTSSILNASLQSSKSEIHRNATQLIFLSTNSLRKAKTILPSS